MIITKKNQHRGMLSNRAGVPNFGYVTLGSDQSPVCVCPKFSVNPLGSERSKESRILGKVIATPHGCKEDSSLRLCPNTYANNVPNFGLIRWGVSDHRSPKFWVK